MELNAADLKLIESLCDGLALVAQPYAELGQRAGLSEEEAIAGITRLIDGGVIKRFGVIVQHHKLGYNANGMSVWNVPDARVREVGARMGEFPFVTLCYRRPRQLPDWPYNLFAMVHGSDRTEVEAKRQEISALLGPACRHSDVLYSKRILKKTGLRLSRNEG